MNKFNMCDKSLTNNFIYKTCIDIKQKFSKYNINFGDNLYKSIEKVTNNFTDNLNFFNLYGKIDEQYLDYILQEYCSHNKNIFLLIVWPVTYNHEKIIHDTYGKYGNILYKKEITIKNKGFKNILHFISDKKNHPWGEKLWFAKPHRYINPLTIYVFESKNITEINNNEKKKYLTEIFNNNRNHINNIEKRGGLNNLYITTKAKRECREVLAKNNCVKEVKGLNDRNYSHHVNDEHYETVELSRIFFNKNSMFAINNCDINFKCKSFNDKYKRYVKFINDNKWGNIEDFCLNNSSILSQFGLRQSRDIDYLHNQSFEIAKQVPEPEISSHNYVVKSVNSNININELVYNPNNYFWYKNIKFCTLEKLLEFKKQQTTDKAKNDVKLLLEYKNIHLTDLPQNIVNKYCESKKIKSVITNHESINTNKILFETTKKYSHYRIIYENNNLIFKLINFNDTSLDVFLSQTKYDVFFKKAINNNFYNTIALINNFIYDKINDEYIGYCAFKLNDIKKYDERKFHDLVDRLVKQFKLTNLVFTDLTINTNYKSNVMEYNDKYYIIDLESVCDMETYIKYKDIRFKNNNKYYEKRLINLIKLR
jgi:hypothetical protein